MDAFISFPVKTTEIQNDYEIYKSRMLGQGINGLVVLCRSKQSNKEYALKTLNHNDFSKCEIGLQLRASQGCENIVKIVDVYNNEVDFERKLFVVMELMSGGELFEVIKSYYGDDSLFTEQDVAKIMLPICKAVKRLHDLNIVHRDLKPENLLLPNKNDISVIKLSDFGIAKLDTDVVKTPCGTDPYMSPEVVYNLEKMMNGKIDELKTYDKSCDIWSLAVIMYVLCCGQLPFDSEHDRAIQNSPNLRRKIQDIEYNFDADEWKKISPDAKSLIKDMLKKLPAERLTIDQILNSKWLTKFKNLETFEAGLKHLSTVRVLRAQKDQRKRMSDFFEQQLAKMREPLRSISLKLANNLLNKRLETSPMLNTIMKPATSNVDLTKIGSKEDLNKRALSQSTSKENVKMAKKNKENQELKKQVSKTKA